MKPTKTIATPVPVRQRLFRASAALMLGGIMTLSAVLTGNAPARAQDGSAGTGEAGVAPATSVFYFGLSLDDSTPQWQVAEQLLAKLGVDNGPAGLLESAASDSGVESGSATIDTTALLGGEVALIVTNLDAASSEASNLADEVGNLGSESGTPSAGDASLTGAASASGSVLVVNPKDLAAATKAVDDALGLSAVSLAVQVTTTNYGGVTIKSIPGNPDTGEAGQAYAVVDDFVVLADTAIDIEPVIDTAAGKIDPLSKVAEFAKADQELAGDRLGFGFVNGSAMMAEAGSSDPATLELLNAFGGLIGANRATGISVVADPLGFRFNTVELPYDGAPAVAGGIAADLSLANKIPANAMFFANGYNVGQGSVLQGLALYLVTTLNSALNPSFGGTPVAMPSVDELFSNAAQFLGFNLKLDLIERLVGQYAFALWNVDMTNPANFGMILTSDTENAAVLADALSKLSLLVQAASSGMANVTTQTIGDSIVSVVTIGDGSTSPAMTIDYGVVDGKFMFGTNDSIEQYQAGFDDSLGDSPDFKAGLAALPTEYDGIYYINLQEAMAASTALESGFSSTGTDLDNSASCARFATQADAQAAYNEDSVTNYDLDLNFNGIACEDYFAASTPEATPDASEEYGALKSFTTVSYKKDGLAYTSSILIVGEN